MDNLCCRITLQRHIRNIVFLWNLAQSLQWQSTQPTDVTTTQRSVAKLKVEELMSSSNNPGDIKVLSKFFSAPYWENCGASFWVLFTHPPPSANKDEALKELYNIVSKYENTYDDAAFIVLGDFNQCNLKTNLAKYEQYITFSTRDQNALDHCYSNIKKDIHCIPKSKPW